MFVGLVAVADVNNPTITFSFSKVKMDESFFFSSFYTMKFIQYGASLPHKTHVTQSLRLTFFPNESNNLAFRLINSMFVVTLFIHL